jgi:hypothetical protein
MISAALVAVTSALAAWPHRPLALRGGLQVARQTDHPK